MNSLQRTLVVLVLATLLGACRREPAIVIRFDAVDMAGAAPGAVDATVASADGATTIAAREEAKPEAKKAAAVPCKTDAECVVVPDGCCDCANGGKQHAVSKREEASVRTAQRASCKDVMCTMMLSVDPTCGKRAACIDGACGLRDARPEEQRGLEPKR